MKYRLLVICLVSIVGFSADSKNSDQALIAGVAIHTFEDSHYVIQTDRYFFRVEKSKLTPDVRTELDRAVQESRWRGFAIPHQAISDAWPVSPSPDDAAVRFSKTNSTRRQDHIIRQGDQVEIAGTVAISFQASHYIFLSNGKLYLILKSALSEKENKQFEKLSIGEPAELSIPAKSLRYAGRFSVPVDSTRVADIARPEGASTNHGHLTISGVVLLSFSDPLVLVRANQIYFQLKRAMIEDPVSGNLNRPGSFVKVRAPIEAVDFVWATPINDDSSLIRAPASNSNH